MRSSVTQWQLQNVYQIYITYFASVLLLVYVVLGLSARLKTSKTAAKFI